MRAMKEKRGEAREVNSNTVTSRESTAVTNRKASTYFESCIHTSCITGTSRHFQPSQLQTLGKPINGQIPIAIVKSSSPDTANLFSFARFYHKAAISMSSIDDLFKVCHSLPSIVFNPLSDRNRRSQLSPARNGN